MNECQYCNHARNCKPLNLRLEPTAPDEKLAFVQNVLDVLIESRFGRGRSSQMVFNLSDRPELEPAVFLDHEDGLMTPCYAVGPEGRFGYQVVEACYRKAVQNGRVRPRINKGTQSPKSLGRGSPELLWDVTIMQARE